MGQQQLLLLVLGIVIVGVAIVAGIVAYNEGRDKAAHNTAVSDAMRIISDVQAWKIKPQLMGGGDSPVATDFSGLNFKVLGYPNATNSADAPYFTANGCFKLAPESTTSAQLRIYADSLQGDCHPGSQIATVEIDGTTADNVQWSFE